MNTLAKLTDEQLLLSIEKVAARSRRNTAELVEHIGEVDARGLFRNEACSSMFTYCTQRLHLSEAAAAKRIQVARATRRFEGLLAYVADGRLHLSGLNLLVPHLTADNWRVVVERAVHRSKREIEYLVAELAPKCGVVAHMRRLPRRAGTGTSNARAGAPLAGALLHEDVPTAGSEGAERGRSSRPTDGGRMEPLAPERFKVQFTADPSLHDKIVQAQALLRHSVPSGDLAEIFDRALTLLLAKHRSRRFGLSSSPRRQKQTGTRKTRHIPAAVRREVFERDGGRCTYVDARERRCTERKLLEFDHIVPYARGGPPTAENIRLRCRAHNQLHAEEIFGAQKVKQQRAR